MIWLGIWRKTLCDTDADPHQALCAAQSIAVSMATANGYGEHYESLSSSSIEEMMKVSEAHISLDTCTHKN